MTRHVLDQLPLWVEGDLSAANLTAVEGHLAECPSCRAAADNLRTSQAWLREAMESPFSPADRANLRRAVMDQIRSEAPHPAVRRLAARPALLAACAAALLVVALTWNLDRPAGISPPKMDVPATPPSAEAPPKPDPPPRLARRNPVPGRSRPTEVPTASPPGTPARIEFQTSDPTIRIIWLAQATHLPEAIPPIQEAP